MRASTTKADSVLAMHGDGGVEAGAREKNGRPPRRVVLKLDGAEIASSGKDGHDGRDVKEKGALVAQSDLIEKKGATCNESR